MNKSSIIIALSLLILSSSASAQQAMTSDAKLKFHKLKWLEGTWNRLGLKETDSAGESWKMISDSLFVGQGFMISESDTLFKEDLKIIRKNGQIFYVARVPENPAPVHFKMKEIGANHFVCENPNHDFPTRISYRFKSGILKATVFGKGKQIEYRFKKI